jgi:hypothetical protein
MSSNSIAQQPPHAAVIVYHCFRFRNIALGFAAGAGIGAGGAYAYLKRLQPTAVVQQAPAELLPNQGGHPLHWLRV